MRDPAHFLFFGQRQGANAFVLGSDETRHAHQVLRAKQGSVVRTTDGSGAVFECCIERVDRDGAHLSVRSSSVGPVVAPRVRCLIGLPERDAFETAIENLAALGVETIVPVETALCQDPWWQDKWARYELRFTAKMVAGCKQSLNPRLPSLLPPQGLDEALRESVGSVLVAQRDGRAAQELLPGPSGGSPEPLTCLVGPPGGLSADELATLSSISAQFVRLGHHRLRTELAATLLCGAVLALVP
jgi:16S rRNA (uracil1498-N3)-methyltransferase